jgi:hypothetical protein
MAIFIAGLVKTERFSGRVALRASLHSSGERARDALPRDGAGFAPPG